MCSFKTKEQANNASNALARKLKKDTGVSFKKVTFENLGWHTSLHYGSINISIHNYSPLKTYMVLNGGNHLSNGNQWLSSFHPNTYKGLLLSIKESIREQEKVTQDWVNALEMNRKMKII